MTDPDPDQELSLATSEEITPPESAASAPPAALTSLRHRSFAMPMIWGVGWLRVWPTEDSRHTFFFWRFWMVKSSQQARL